MKRLLSLSGASFLALGCLALFCAACEEKPEPAPSSATTTPAKNATSATQPGAESDPPTEQDLEEQAEKEIPSENAVSELDKIEKEIGQ